MTNLPAGDPRHGINGYQNLGCKCDICRAANTAANLAARIRRHASITPDDPRHGTETFYFNYRCNCDLCREAHRVAQAGRRAARK